MGLPYSTIAINYHLKSQVLLLCNMRHLFQYVLQALLCGMGNVVDHICAQLTDTELLTCRNRSEYG